jgi:glyoxylase-like metal-dependent hydrolase (beta-lactamase superfamily II)
VSEFTEVADRVWVARYDWFDVNVSVVAGAAGLLVVDTNASDRAARTVLADLRRLSSAPLLAAVNTHVHFDHTFGNGVLAAEGAELVAHENAAAALPAHAAQTRARAAEEADGDQRYAELVATEVVVPARTFSSALALDLGDRVVELVHPGRGHTDGDVVVRVPDADVVLSGDLVEESTARDGVPGFGSDCFPMDWPQTLDLVLSLVGPDTVVVPGHGSPVDRDFVQEQRSAIGVVAETIRDLAGRGIRLDDALDAADWPYPREELADAVRRGYEHLPRAQKRLPLI